MNNLIELQDVNLIRNGKALLKEINWQVKENECWAILGLNGAGKSTLLKLLMSEYWASSGQVTVLGTRFGEGGIPELRKRIGIVSSFISERLPEHLLTEQIVLTGQYKSSILYAAYGEEELNWARDMLTSIGASSLIGRKYRELSQGEKQTVLIARSLMDQPDLIIFDEASSGLDLFARRKAPPSDPSYQTTGSRANHDLRHPPCRGNYKRHDPCPLTQTWPSGRARAKGKDPNSPCPKPIL